ncbi:hypothetical protein BJ878DRAFT_258753 [Calycina marina]|uniref:Uncharacterized protein n=1 Tax=Calycina marina TaxID=1763456 RepID=A0A9P8CH04_9HELO|nr:hypothetical protein BJ878DRAFT_258753 [Calycina marina]
MLALPLRRSATLFHSTASMLSNSIRRLTTLPSNPHIYIFPHPSSPSSHILSLLPTTPPTTALAILTTTSLPPTPASCTPNPVFTSILSSVLRQHAAGDPWLRNEAAAFAHGSGGRGGWIHVSDRRCVPDYGRIAWPEDIFGSLEVDAAGRFVEGGWQESGTYRVVTRDGM